MRNPSTHLRDGAVAPTNADVLDRRPFFRAEAWCHHPRNVILLLVESVENEIKRNQYHPFMLSMITKNRVLVEKEAKIDDENLL